MKTHVVIQAKLFTPNYKPRFFLWRLVMFCKKGSLTIIIVILHTTKNSYNKILKKPPKNAPKRLSYKMKGMEIKAETKSLEI